MNKCFICQKEATKQIKEVISLDDFGQNRSPLIANVCEEHFYVLMGISAPRVNDMLMEYFDCSCASPEHILRFIYDPQDNNLYTEVHLSQYRNVFKRIWIAIKYVFGYRCKYGNWDCWELNMKDCDRLKNLIEKVIEHKYDSPKQ